MMQTYTPGFILQGVLHAIWFIAMCKSEDQLKLSSTIRTSFPDWSFLKQKHNIYHSDELQFCFITGTLGFVDFDEVEISNLHRQVLHTEDRVGVSKVISAARSCER